MVPTKGSESALLLLLLLGCLASCTLGLSSSSPASPEIMPKRFISITNPADTSAEDKLPASFVEHWPTWTLDGSGSLDRIPDSDGFVQPSSIDELYQPIDLKRPSATIAIGVHVRQGTVRHVMPAVDVCYEGGLHRNRGVCSVPRAHAWIDFSDGMAAHDWEGFCLRAARRKHGEHDDHAWEDAGAVVSGSTVSGALERLLLCLAESPPDEIGEGSHMIHVLLEGEGGSLELPKNGHDLRVTMEEPDARIGEAPGILEVTVCATMAGSESEYLPDVYRPLYDNTEFRNPLYDKFKKRQQSKK